MNPAEPTKFVKWMSCKWKIRKEEHFIINFVPLQIKQPKLTAVTANLPKTSISRLSILRLICSTKDPLSGKWQVSKM